MDVATYEKEIHNRKIDVISLVVSFRSQRVLVVTVEIYVNL